MPKLLASLRKVVYPVYSVEFCVKPERKVAPGMKRRGPLTSDDLKKLLGWETEAAYESRTGSKFPETLDIPIFTDVEGARVVCWNNAKNRPFEREWALARAQDILTGCWRFNMENLIISLYGTVLSAQHRGVGLIFADQLWRSKQHWKSLLPNPPTIECTIAYGCEETSDVLQTFDNVRTRTESDVIYTSDIFAGLNHFQRAECSRMQAAAIDLLWKRTGAGKNSDSWNRYKTHSTAMDFASRHKRITECVHHIFACNTSRKLVLLRLSPGQCAAMQYMMAACATDRDVYANGSRNESEVDFSSWDDAKEFWKQLGEYNPRVKPLVDGLKMLVDPSESNKGRMIEKISLIALAWNVWRTCGHQLAESDVLTREGGYLHPKLVYSEDRTTLLEPESFRGIDEGYKSPKKESVDEEGVENRKKKVKEEKERPVVEDYSNAVPTPLTLVEKRKQLLEQHK